MERTELEYFAEAVKEACGDDPEEQLGIILDSRDPEASFTGFSLDRVREKFPPNTRVFEVTGLPVQGVQDANPVQIAVYRPSPDAAFAEELNRQVEAGEGGFRVCMETVFRRKTGKLVVKVIPENAATYTLRIIEED